METHKKAVMYLQWFKTQNFNAVKNYLSPHAVAINLHGN